MFKLTPNPTFKAKVLLSVPGQEKPIPVEVEFKHLDNDALLAYYETLTAKTNAAGLMDIIVSWSGFDAGFSSESLDTLLKNYPTAAGELYTAYRRELMESKTKN
jgi:hypothetical protein